MRASLTAQYLLFQEQEPRNNELRACRLTSTTLFQSMRGRPRTLALQEATACGTLFVSIKDAVKPLGRFRMTSE
jgi:hypothetical protein